MSSTYSFWPSSEIKKEVEMKFYEIPLNNFKLECWQQPEDIQKQIREARPASSSGNSMPELLNMVTNMASSVLFVLIIPPIVSGKGTIICSPLACITVAGMFVALIV